MKCLVKGCRNEDTQGAFVGDVCKPCYRMLTTGDVSHGETFIDKLHAAARKVVDARYDHSDRGWDTLKNAIGELESLVGRTN